jgi:hypothetical protein
VVGLVDAHEARDAGGVGVGDLTALAEPIEYLGIP